MVLSDKPEVSLLDSIHAVRAEFLSRSASEADFLFRLKTATKLSVPSMRRLAANASKLWNLPRQLSRLLYYNLWSYSDQEIADAMGLSRHTIQEYQDELRRRTGVRTKHAYLRRLLEYAGEEPPLSMSDTTRAHVTQFRRRLENGGLHRNRRGGHATPLCEKAGLGKPGLFAFTPPRVAARIRRSAPRVLAAQRKRAR